MRIMRNIDETHQRVIMLKTTVQEQKRSLNELRRTVIEMADEIKEEKEEGEKKTISFGCKDLRWTR